MYFGVSVLCTYFKCTSVLYTYFKCISVKDTYVEFQAIFAKSAISPQRLQIGVDSLQDFVVNLYLATQWTNKNIFGIELFVVKSTNFGYVAKNIIMLVSAE